MDNTDELSVTRSRKRFVPNVGKKTQNLNKSREMEGEREREMFSGSIRSEKGDYFSKLFLT